MQHPAEHFPVLLPLARRLAGPVARRLRTRSALAAGSVVALAGLVWVVLTPGADASRLAAALYGEYARAYERGDAGVSSCYGRRWDDYGLGAITPDLRAHRDDPAY